MLGKIIGAIAGSKIADRVSGINSPMGAAAGVVTATALRRMSLPALIVLGAGGYLAKRIFDKKQSESATPAMPQPRRSAI
ncbi:MAG: hypothetical protein KDE32_09515 [Novosphingobium sp.]|nr:hypothetical protein [Novosphingobium sp.]